MKSQRGVQKCWKDDDETQMRVMEVMKIVCLHLQRHLKCKSLVKDCRVVFSRKSGKKEIPIRSARMKQNLEKMDNSMKTHTRCDSE